MPHNLRRVDFQELFSLLQLDRSQLTVVCCNRREREHHTSHVACSQCFTRTCVAQVVCLSCAHHVSSSCVCSDSLRLRHFPLSADHLLSYHPVLPPAHQLYLPGCGGQIPCALPLMRTLAPLPSTTLSQKGERGRRESDSQVTCHLNSVHALAFMNKHGRHTSCPHHHHHPLLPPLPHTHSQPTNQTRLSRWRARRAVCWAQSTPQQKCYPAPRAGKPRHRQIR